MKDIRLAASSIVIAFKSGSKFNVNKNCKSLIFYFVTLKFTRLSRSSYLDRLCITRVYLSLKSSILLFTHTDTVSKRCIAQLEHLPPSKLLCLMRM